MTSGGTEIASQESSARTARMYRAAGLPTRSFWLSSNQEDFQSIVTLPELDRVAGEQSTSPTMMQQIPTLAEQTVGLGAASGRNWRTP